MKIPAWLGGLASGWTLVFWVVCVVVPVARLLGHVSGAAGAGFWDAEVLATAWATARQAALSTGIAAAIGLPLGLCMARLAGRARSAAEGLALLPQAVPTVVAATAWVAWLGRSGWLAGLGLHWDLAYSLWAVILAHVFFNAPWIALAVSGARRAVPTTGLEAAAMLGAGAWARFRFVVWPGIRWALAASAAQVLAFCSMSFALVLLLGGGPPVETLETALYAHLRSGTLDLSGAACCAAWEMVLTLLPWAVVLGLRARQRGGGARVRLVQASRPAPGWAQLLLLGGLAFFVLPYGAVLAGAGSWVRPEFWREVARPLALSLEIAGLTAAGALLTAVCATIGMAWAPGRVRGLVGVALAMPSGLSVLVLGLGAWLAYGRWIDPFEGSLAAIVGLQITVFFPVVFRMLWPLAQQGQRASMEAAWTLGASAPRAFWLVEWPRWRGPVVAALALVAAAALGEVAAVSLFYSERLIPLPLLVSRWMAQYRFEDARSVAALLFVGAAAVIGGVTYAGNRRTHVALL